MSLIKKIIFYLIVIFSLFIVWINFNLYFDNFDKQENVEDIILQLNFLGFELKNNNLGDRMQEIFPEGFVFSNVLYGLAWCELGIADSNKKELALNEAVYAYNEINSIKAKSIFSYNSQTENGIFYLGWNNYLLSKIIFLDSSFSNRNYYYQSKYIQQCYQIVDAMNKNNSPYLESYTNQSWPADMTVAVASLSNHDKIYLPKHQSLITNWIDKVKSKLDPKTNLIPHKVNSKNGETIEGARGCSISLILRLLSEIDIKFAKEQYELYKNNFVSTTFGLPSINEYPAGQSGIGDIDSGPVIFGVGFAGTIVAIGTFSVFGDQNLSENQYKTINAFGLSYRTEKFKKYIFGQLPIADLFIAWGRSSALNQEKKSNTNLDYWRFKFHIFSILLISFFGLFFIQNRFILNL